MGETSSASVPARRRDELESTAVLLKRARAGDRPALNRLVERYRPVLLRLAHGRIPHAARALLDTNDLVQNTLLRALEHLEGFEPRREGAFLAYLRQILFNQIRDEARRVARRPAAQPVEEDQLEGGRSPLEVTVGREMLEAYERALAQLKDQQREAVILRVELGFTFQEIAVAVGFPSDGAARMAVIRAVARIAKLMDAHRDSHEPR